MLSPFLFVALVLRSWLLRYAEAFCFHWHCVDGSSNRSIRQVFEYFFSRNCPQQLQYSMWLCFFFRMTSESQHSSCQLPGRSDGSAWLFSPRFSQPGAVPLGDRHRQARRSGRYATRPAFRSFESKSWEAIVIASLKAVIFTFVCNCPPAAKKETFSKISLFQYCFCIFNSLNFWS